MDPEFARFAEDAENIRTSGRWAQLNQRIEELCADPGDCEAWRVKVLAGLAYSVFAEYVAMKKAAKEETPALLAWRARNLLELVVWSMFCSKSKTNARRFYEDAGRDAKDIYAAFIKWGEGKQAKDWLKPLEMAGQELQNRARTEGIDSLDGSYKGVNEAAVECGIQNHYQLIFKLLSKFAHPTAMQVVANPDNKRDKAQCDLFFGYGCLFFVGAFDALERALKGA